VAGPRLSQHDIPGDAVARGGEQLGDVVQPQQFIAVMVQTRVGAEVQQLRFRCEAQRGRAPDRCGYRVIPEPLQREHAAMRRRIDQRAVQLQFEDARPGGPAQHQPVLLPGAEAVHGARLRRRAIACGEYPQGGVDVRLPHQQIDIVHRSQADVPVDGLSQRRALEDHDRHAGTRQRAQDLAECTEREHVAE